MQDVAIVGGGVCGLALAGDLGRAGRDWALFESRPRLGGRILGSNDGSGTLDLGATWFWPERQSLVADLVAGLGLRVIPQHDSGTVLLLRDAEAGPETQGTGPVHGGACRVAGGMAGLVDRMAAGLDPVRLHLGHVLTAVTDNGDHVRLQFETGAGPVEVTARQVVLALPPRLLAERVRFDPPLDPSVMVEMAAAATWMASQAKAVVRFPQAGWRDEGASGNAFVTHERAVLAEIFDLCDPGAAGGALGGFLALTPETRRDFRTGLPMLVANQMGQVFGASATGGAPVIQDWAEEVFTASRRDLEEDGAADRTPGGPALRRAHWQGRLHFAGSETARRGAGHIEGALDSARRTGRQLALAVTMPEPAAGPIDLADWLDAQREPVFEAYRSELTRRLSRQDSDRLTQLAALRAVEDLLDDALVVLAQRPAGGAAALAEVKAEVRAFLNRFAGEVMAFNRSSCALRAFPDEHALPKAYLQAILADMAAAGGAFLIEADAILRARTEAA
ncbi:MAG: FAD-dependent oxidoreductase [Mangrovicoccus sp.]|nr:FAD-dependent oxidoreductase [Mangrovicoccus sp.]